MNKPDRRTQRTRKNIVDAYVRITSKRTNELITVTEVAREADINRSTFYLHFKDVADLHEAIENEVFSNLLNIVCSNNLEDIKRDSLPLFIELFTYFDRHSEILVILLDIHGSITANRRLGKVIEQKLQTEWRSIIPYGEDRENGYYVSFMINGVIGVLQSWIETGKQETPRDLASSVKSMIDWGLSHGGSRIRESEPKRFS